MKKQLVYVTVIWAVLGCFGIAKAEEKSNKVKVKLSGFISAEAFYDTRQMVAGRDGDAFFYPKPEVLDGKGNDINANGNFNFTSIHSRLRAKTTPYNIWGGNVTALFEMDFAGTGNDKIGLIRLRHLMLKYTKGKSSLLFGQYWHPMFVASCAPAKSSWDAGIPMAVLARHPQIRFSYDFTDKFRGSITALSQLDFKSMGEKGKSTEYIRNSGMPEFDVHFEYGNPKKFITGFVAGTKALRPRTVNHLNNKVDEIVHSYHVLAYTKYLTPKMGYKAEAIYAQNANDLLLLGGYAVSDIDRYDASFTYTTIASKSFWTEVFSRYDSNINWGVFVGYAENLGASDKIMTATPKIYARGANIDNVWKIAPRIVWGKKNFKIMAELNQIFASYGMPDSDLKVQDANRLGNTRFQLHFKYSF